MPDKCLLLEAIVDISHYEKLTSVLDRIRHFSQTLYGKTSSSPIMDLGPVEKDSCQSIYTEFPTTDPFLKTTETHVESQKILVSLHKYFTQSRGCSTKVLHTLKIRGRRLQLEGIFPLNTTQSSDLKIDISLKAKSPE